MPTSGRPQQRKTHRMRRVTLSKDHQPFVARQQRESLSCQSKPKPCHKVRRGASFGGSSKKGFSPNQKNLFSFKIGGKFGGSFGGKFENNEYVNTADVLDTGTVFMWRIFIGSVKKLGIIFGCVIKQILKNKLKKSLLIISKLNLKQEHIFLYLVFIYTKNVFSRISK